jgi:hypothetical protein
MSLQEDRTLLTGVLACAAVTLFHHAHNAEFLADYPGMPVSVTPAAVYAAWLCATVVGIAGYVLVTRSDRVAGLALLAAYGAYGLAGLVHYLLAPLSAHTVAMNMSIAGEAVAATALLVVLFRRLASSGRPSP